MDIDRPRSPSTPAIGTTTKSIPRFQVAAHMQRLPGSSRHTSRICPTERLTTMDWPSRSWGEAHRMCCCYIPMKSMPRHCRISFHPSDCAGGCLCRRRLLLKTRSTLHRQTHCRLAKASYGRVRKPVAFLDCATLPRILSMKSQSSARRHCCLRWEGQVGIELQMPINRWATAGRL